MAVHHANNRLKHVQMFKTIELQKPGVGKSNLSEHLLGGTSRRSPRAVRLGLRGGFLKLRKEMGTYGNLRPCFFAPDSTSPRSRPTCVEAPTLSLYESLLGPFI